MVLVYLTDENSKTLVQVWWLPTVKRDHLQLSGKRTDRPKLPVHDKAHDWKPLFTLVETKNFDCNTRTLPTTETHQRTWSQGNGG